MRVAHSGRAKISVRRPAALGECDLCSSWWNRRDLIRQQQWSGNSLIDTGLVVCRDCLDVPQDQYRTLILPADPMPIFNPRPSPNTTPVPAFVGLPLPTTPENLGFTQYRLGPATFIGGLPTQAGVLAQVSALSAVATPINGLASYVVPMTGNTVSLVPANSTRGFLLLFNPTQFVAQVSFGLAVQGGLSNLSIGPNEAYFWSTNQGLSPVYQGAITAVGLFPSLPLWAWEDNSNLIVLYNDGGVLALTFNVAGYQMSPTGLPPGAVWNNGLTIAVIPGIVPNPAAPPIFFGSVTAATLLATGGGNLPLGDPGVPLQLYNDGGLIAVSLGGLKYVTDQHGNIVTDQHGNPIPIY